MHLCNFEVLDMPELLSEVLKNALFKRSHHAFTIFKIELLKASLGREPLLERGEELAGDLCACMKHCHFAFLDYEVARLM